jgi:hypothetical protein
VFAIRALPDAERVRRVVTERLWEGVLGAGVGGSSHPRLWELLAKVRERDLPRVRLRLKPKGSGVTVVIGSRAMTGIEQVDEIPGPIRLLRPCSWDRSGTSGGYTS